jgi:hypothetical protein
MVAIEIANHSDAFAPRLRVYDERSRILSWGEMRGRPGESVKVVGGPPPNSKLHLSISSDNGNGGMYLLTVTPLKAFDRFEPNDDIMASRRVSIGEEVDANVMDDGDIDFFSFVSPRKGAVTVELRNRSATLLPVLAVYDADRRNVGFANDAPKPGANLRHTIDVDKDKLYYLQISAQSGSSGAYVLRID